MILHGLTKRRRRFEPVPASRWARLKPPPAIIDGILRRGSLAFLYGRDGAGKSFVALDMAFCVALGLPWVGRRTVATPTIYVAAEDGFGIGERIRAWEQSNPDADSSQLLILGDPVNLFSRPPKAGEPVLPPDVEAALKEWDALEQRPGLVILDTLARSMLGADESSNSDMALVVAAAEHIQSHYNATVLMIAHTGKDQARGLRGASALHAAADTAIKVRRTKNENLLIECSKVRHWKAFDPIRGRLVSVDLPDGGSSCVVQYDANLKADAPAIRSNMEAIWNQIGAATPMIFRDLLQNTGLANSSFSRGLLKLVEAGLVRKLDGGKGYVRDIAYDGMSFEDAVSRVGL